MNTGQGGFIEADVFIVFECIAHNTALVDLRQQTLDIDPLKGRTTRRQQIDSGRKQITGTKDIALLDMVASRCQFHQSVEKFSGLSRFKRDELFKVVMTLQKFTPVEELDPSL